MPKLVETCVACLGTGKVDSPAWADWLAVKRKADADRQKCGPPPKTPSVIPCKKCDGLGCKLDLDARIFCRVLEKIYGLKPARNV